MRGCLLFLLSLLVCLAANTQPLRRAQLDTLEYQWHRERSDSIRVQLLNQIAHNFYDVGGKKYSDSCKYYLDRALAISRKTKYTRGLAEALFNYGVYNLSISRHMVEATPSFLESLSLFEEMNDSAGISKCYLQLGVISFTMQYYEDAIRKNILALRYKQNTVSKYLLAISYAELDSFAQARNYFFESIYANQHPVNNQRLIECYMYYGKMLIHEGKTDSGFYYLHQAIHTVRSLGDSMSLSRPYAFLASAWLSKNEIDNTIYYGEKAFANGVQNSDEISTAESAYALSSAYAQKGNFSKAYHYLNYLYAHQVLNASGGIMQKVADMQSQFAYDKQMNEAKFHLEKDRALAAEQINQQKIIRNALLIGAIMLLLLLAGLYNRFSLKRRANRELEIKNLQIMQEKERSDALLLNILPLEIADELKRNGTSAARLYNHVTVIFTDFVNFTGISENMHPTELVQEIHKHFTAFDAIIEKHGLEKIKTIGDAYLAVCGMPVEQPEHARRVVLAAREIQQYILRAESSFEIRIGIHSGSVVAGIVGVKKYAYDIWGDAVNTAARMEQHSEPGRINISETTFALLQGEFTCSYRGKIKAKNKGEIDMYFLESYM